MTLAQTAGNDAGCFVVGKGKRKGNHAMLGSDAQEVAPMSTLVSMPKVGSIPRGWTRLPLSDASASKGCVSNLLSAGESNLIAQ